MKSQYDKIWCLQYDEDSYYHSLSNVNFAKYLMNILSNIHYPKFQQQVQKELQDSSLWTERSWFAINLFEYLNEVFELNRFEDNVSFQPNKRVRNLFGAFRMWIDMQRLYLFSFLKLDKMQFEEDRLFFCFFRTLNFFKDFFSESRIDFFNQNYLLEISAQLNKRIKQMINSYPRYFQQYLQQITHIIPNFLNRRALVDIKIGQQIKKLAYQKLSYEYEIIQQIQQRLISGYDFKRKEGLTNNLKKTVDSDVVVAHGEQVRSIYDPRFRIMNNFRQKAQKEKTTIDQELLMEEIDKYNKKIKEKPTNQTPYQGINRVGHNPYEGNNFLMYGEYLGVDLQKKNEMENMEMDNNESFSEYNTYVYPPEYIQQSRQLNNFKANVVNEDLNFSASKAQHKYVYVPKNQNKLSNTYWEKFMGVPDSEKQKTINLAALTTIQSANASKDLQRNTLFKKKEDEEIQANEIKEKMFRQIFQKGLQSRVLFLRQNKAQTLYDLHSTFSNQMPFSIKHKCFLDRNKFDSIRKVIQHSTVLKKIDKWIHIKQVPDRYPRGIQQIKQHSCFPEQTVSKRKLALQVTFDQD